MINKGSRRSREGGKRSPRKQWPPLQSLSMGVWLGVLWPLLELGLGMSTVG